MQSGRIIKPILDTRTGKEYRSQAAAGRDLAHLVKGDPKDTFVWFKIARSLPDRFRTKNPKGDWVPLDDPSVPIGTLRAWEEGPTPPGEARVTTRLTTIEIDEGKFQRVKAILGVPTLRETVDQSFDEVLARAAREQVIAQLQTMNGLDLDKPDVMAKAWR